MATTLPPYDWSTGDEDEPDELMDYDPFPDAGVVDELRADAALRTRP